MISTRQHRRPPCCPRRSLRCTQSVADTPWERVHSGAERQEELAGDCRRWRRKTLPPPAERPPDCAFTHPTPGPNTHPSGRLTQTHVHIHTNMCKHTCTPPHTKCTHPLLNTHKHMHANTRTLDTDTHVCMHVSTHTTCAHTQEYTQTRTHQHTRTLTNITRTYTCEHTHTPPRRR